MKWFLKCLRQFSDVKGRARRKEYWMFYLFYLIFVVAAGFIDEYLGLTLGNTSSGPIEWIVNLGLLIPFLSVAVRRKHDVGKSGWFSLVPIYNLVLNVTKGDLGSNKYGPDPKNPDFDVEDHLIDSEE